MKIQKLNNQAIKKALKAYGINALVRGYKGITSSIFVESKDIDSAVKFMESFGIKRFCNVNGVSQPFQVNGGEFNSLVLVGE
jgi:hypothetical protein